MGKAAEFADRSFEPGLAIRNFLLFGRCEAGDCPERQIGLYLALAASIILMLTILFPQIELKEDKGAEV